MLCCLNEYENASQKFDFDIGLAWTVDDLVKDLQNVMDNTYSKDQL